MSVEAIRNIVRIQAGGCRLTSRCCGVGVRRSAVYSRPTPKFRYALIHEWSPGDSTMVFVGLNPSTATHVVDDPTMRRVRRFAADSGCGCLIMVNLFAFRAKSPAGLKATADPVGPLNDELIRAAVHEEEFIVVGWGTHGSFKKRDAAVLGTLTRPENVGRDGLGGCNKELVCLGTTKGGQPKHPLYLAADTEWESYA